MAAKKIVQVIWTEPALAELDEIADYIALDNVSAAKRLVERVFAAADRLVHFPNSGRMIPELPHLAYRELIVHPCRVLFRVDGKKAYVVLVTRAEQLLEEHRLWRNR